MKKYRVEFGKSGSRIVIGYFSSKEEAWKVAGDLPLSGIPMVYED